MACFRLSTTATGSMSYWVILNGPLQMRVMRVMRVMRSPAFHPSYQKMHMGLNGQPRDETPITRPDPPVMSSPPLPLPSRSLLCNNNSTSKYYVLYSVVSTRNEEPGSKTRIIRPLSLV